MCELCTKHGDGKKWYLNAKNYSADLLSDVRRRRFVKDFFYWLDDTYKQYSGLVKALPLGVPLIGPSLKKMIKRTFINKNWGQVIPIEDVKEVLLMASSVVRIPCVCRKITTGKERRMCFLITFNPGKIGMADIVDQSFFGGPDVAKFEVMKNDAALKVMIDEEKKGVFHSIWAHGTPYIAGLCNCDDTGCIPKEMYRSSAPFFFKAEYFAKVDTNICVGCKACLTVCPFESLSYDSANAKVKVNHKRCYGCGVCRSVCRKNALRLIPREQNPLTAKIWY